jgi:hypothetical protein
MNAVAAALNIAMLVSAILASASGLMLAFQVSWSFI